MYMNTVTETTPSDSGSKSRSSGEGCLFNVFAIYTFYVLKMALRFELKFRLKHGFGADQDFFMLYHWYKKLYMI